MLWILTNVLDQGGEGEKTKLSALNGQHLHPSLERAYATLQGLDEDTDRDLSFESLLVEQEWLEPPQVCLSLCCFRYFPRPPLLALTAP